MTLRLVGTAPCRASPQLERGLVTQGCQPEKSLQGTAQTWLSCFTHLDAGCQHWNNALRQQLLPHSLTFYYEVPQCVQTQLLQGHSRAGGDPRAASTAQAPHSLLFFYLAEAEI